MAPNFELLLFQTNSLAPFSKGAWGEVLTITFPAWKPAVPMWKPQCVTKELMVTNGGPQNPSHFFGMQWLACQ